MSSYASTKRTVPITLYGVIGSQQEILVIVTLVLGGQAAQTQTDNTSLSLCQSTTKHTAPLIRGF